MTQGIIFNGKAATGSPIKNIQHTTVTIDSGDTSGTATIDAVVVANSSIIVTGFSINNSTINMDIVGHHIELTNTTTVTGTRLDTFSTMTIKVTIVEYKTNILKSNQTGTVSIGETSATDTIDAVVLAKSQLNLLGFTLDAGSDITSDAFFPALDLSTTTTVRGIRDDAFNTCIAYYQVIEFN